MTRREQTEAALRERQVVTLERIAVALEQIDQHLCTIADATADPDDWPRSLRHFGGRGGPPTCRCSSEPEITLPLATIGSVLWFAGCVRLSSTRVSHTNSPAFASRANTNSATLVSMISSS